MKKTKAAVANGASKNAADSRSQRYEELRTILEDRRREIQSEVQSRMKDVRADTGQAGVVDDVETSESDIQDEIEFALIQMKAETLNKIDEALRRLEEGTYGYCFECGEEISEKRLRDLVAALEAVPVGSLFEARERFVDFVQRFRLHLDERELDIFLDIDFRRFTRVEDLMVLIGTLGANVTDLALNFVHDLALALDEHPLQIVIPGASRRFGNCNFSLLSFGRHDSRSFSFPTFMGKL
jgi:DnaK suppressor protein